MIPIGFLSEEAQEARNKDFKKYRQHNSRKNTNVDLSHMLLISSDPFISSLRRLPKKTQSDYDEEVLALLRDEVEEVGQEETLFEKNIPRPT